MIESPPQVAVPKVTIAIPTLNRAAYLRLALESALSQSYGNIEVVVSNNASTDETAIFLASFTDPRLHVLHQPELLSMVENWNACVAAATGEYFLLLSDDDLLEPTAIQELVAGYSETDENHPVPGIVYCGGRIIDSAGRMSRIFKRSPSREDARDLIPAFFKGERDLWLCAILFRTADIFPGFSPEYKWASDSMLWMRTVIKYRDAIFVPMELVRYRVHENATSLLPLVVWKSEITRLAEFAIDQYRRMGEPDLEFASRVNEAVSRLIVRTIPVRINQSLGQRKLAALREYDRQLPAFLSPYGIKFLTRGLISLFLTKESKIWLRSILRKEPVSLE